MLEALKKLRAAHKQTKYFILMAVIYMVAIIWTTIQAYARLEYSRSDRSEPIVINEQPNESSNE